MKKIANPFAELDGYFCYGCSPKNASGLHMEFFWDGSDVVSTWEPRHEHQGYHEVLHGGIQATLLDEIASWAVFVSLDTGGFTKELCVRYKRPAKTNGGPVEVRARVVSSDSRSAQIHCTLAQNGHLCTAADATYAILPRHIAERRMNLPTRADFLPE